MRATFAEHFRLTAAELDDVYREGVLVLDANVLLQLYRYSERTAKELLQMLETLKERVWVPYQAGREFFGNRQSVISQMSKENSDAATTLTTLLRTLESKNIHPFLPDHVLQELTSASRNANEFLAKESERLEGMLDKDPILDRLCSLLEGRVGPQPNDEELARLEKEGHRRIEAKIPPGFRDKRPGDFILWSQLLAFAKTEKRPVLLVTNDQKDDWVLQAKGKSYGPLPALRKEFSTASRLPFHLVTVDRLMDQMQQRQVASASQEAIAEVRDIRHASAQGTELSPDDFEVSENAVIDWLQLIYGGGAKIFLSAPPNNDARIKVVSDGMRTCVPMLRLSSKAILSHGVSIIRRLTQVPRILETGFERVHIIAILKFQPDLLPETWLQSVGDHTILTKGARLTVGVVMNKRFIALHDWSLNDDSKEVPF